VILPVNIFWTASVVNSCSWRRSFTNMKSNYNCDPCHHFFPGRRNMTLSHCSPTLTSAGSSMGMARELEVWFQDSAYIHEIKSSGSNLKSLLLCSAYLFTLFCIRILNITLWAADLSGYAFHLVNCVFSLSSSGF
jgi:hypothetical protein